MSGPLLACAARRSRAPRAVRFTPPGGHRCLEHRRQPTAAPQSDDKRYTFNRVDEGYLRLDGRTGQVSICASRQVGWACHAVADERAALEAEIARLQAESATLKKELIYPHVWPTRRSARAAIFSFIEGWYNRARLHSTLQYTSPACYEEDYYRLTLAA